MTKKQTTTQKKSLSFRDVLRFTGGYWIKQPKKLTLILCMILIGTLFEAYLPSALSSFLSAVQTQNDKVIVLYWLGVFIGVYLINALLTSLSYITYNSFETNLFKSLMDDVFAHVQRLSQHFFINTFTGSIVSKINRARHQIEVFEDQILVRIFPTVVMAL